MASAFTSANSSTNSLTQKLRDLGRLRPSKSDDDEKPDKKKKGKHFEIVHTPDRPTRLVTPVEAPTEEECGDAIARWQRASASASASAEEGRRAGMFSRYQHRESKSRTTDTGVGGVQGRQPALRNRYGGLTGEEEGRELGKWDDGRRPGLARLDRREDDSSFSSSVMTESEDDEGGWRTRQHHGTGLVGGREVGRGGNGEQAGLQRHRALRVSSRRQKRVADAEYGEEQERSQGGVARCRQRSDRETYSPAPLFSGTSRRLPPISHPHSVGPARATVDRDNSPAQPRYTGIRTEIYRHGFCPYCRKFFGRNSLPLACPYLDCKRDLSLCLRYPNRREAEKAPPRLAQRALLGIYPKTNLVVQSQGIASRLAVPSLTIEAPTPIDEKQKPATHRPPPPPPHQQQRKSPSPSSTIRTIWPSPLGIYYPEDFTQPATPERQRYMEKPLPPPPPPPPPTRSARRPPPPPPPPTTATTITNIPQTISERHRQLYRQPHITSQMRSPGSTPPVTSPSPLSREITPGRGTPSPTPSSLSVSPSPSSSPFPSRSPHQSPSPNLIPTPSPTLNYTSRLPTSRYRTPSPATNELRPRTNKQRNPSPGKGTGTGTGREGVRQKGEKRSARQSASLEAYADLFMDIIGQYEDGDYSLDEEKEDKEEEEEARDGMQRWV